nr:MAG TPA: hypothetical protein [Caudoviricetes sp.]
MSNSCFNSFLSALSTLEIKSIRSLFSTIKIPFRVLSSSSVKIKYYTFNLNYYYCCNLSIQVDFTTEFLAVKSALKTTDLFFRKSIIKPNFNSKTQEKKTYF